MRHLSTVRYAAPVLLVSLLGMSEAACSKKPEPVRSGETRVVEVLEVPVSPAMAATSDAPPPVAANASPRPSDATPRADSQAAVSVPSQQSVVALPNAMPVQVQQYSVVPNDSLDANAGKDPISARQSVVVNAGCTGVIPDTIVRGNDAGDIQPSVVNLQKGATVRFEASSISSLHAVSGDYETSIADLTCVTFNRSGSYELDANDQARGTITVL